MTVDSKSVENVTGPLYWYPFNTDTQETAPLYTGIYIMRHTEPFGRLRGTSDILYIGSTNLNIRQRLAGYLNPGPTQRTNIRINKMLQKYPVEIAWRKTDNSKKLETKLLEQYFNDHDEQPPFNYQGPRNKDSNPANVAIRKMGNRERILEHLRENPEGACDDCISIQLKITPRQQVNQICNRLADEGLITRQKTKCPKCTKKMIINKMLS